MSLEQGSSLRRETLNELETLLAVKETLSRGRHKDVLRTTADGALRHALQQIDQDTHSQVRELWAVLEASDEMSAEPAALREPEAESHREILESYAEFLEASAEILERASEEFPPSGARDVLADLAARDRDHVRLLRRLLDQEGHRDAPPTRRPASRPPRHD